MKYTKKNNNIDYWYMAEAYESIDNWFSNGHQESLPLFSNYFKENVSVIWYEVDDEYNLIKYQGEQPESMID